LQRAGVLQRVRVFEQPLVRQMKERRLEATGSGIGGPRARTLVAYVGANGPLRRSDALLAGFSNALIARAVREGALRETEAPVAARRATQAGAGAASALEPNAEQREVIATISAGAASATFAEFLLQGVTGSGKTLVYLETIAGIVRAGGRALVLVPEISLTPQTARRFEAAFGERVAVLHSALSERERFESWTAAGRGDVDVVVGARSAVFAPLPDVRLIVVDEAHERTYKQDSAPRYDAVAVARRRMAQAGGTLVLGSATPPLEAYDAALRGAVEHLRLTRRATNLPLPDTHLVDLGAEFAAGNRRIFSTRLVEALGERLRTGEKSVLFVNRRGSARFLLCRACGHVPNCARCDLSLVAHRAEMLLRCHLCDAQRPLPERCPSCGDGSLREFGIGTQTVAQAVRELYPRARVVRMDGDTTTRVGDHARLLDEFETRARG
jgi:primosomal protein N' (replication factor Y)